MPSGSLIKRSEANALKKKGNKLTKKQAGSLGGQATVKRWGKTYMHNLACSGARAFHKKYKLSPLGTCDFALVDRQTGVPTGKTIRGLKLSRNEGWKP